MTLASSTCPKYELVDLNLPLAEPIGSGAISHVVQSTLRQAPHPKIAVKIVSKVQLLQQNKVQAAMNEKHALTMLGPHPFIVRLYGTTQSDDELYFVMEYLPHGDLLQHIRTSAAHRTTQLLMTDVESLDGSSSIPFVPKPRTSAVRCLDFHDIQLITAQLVLGLSHVFVKGFVLRDLKPENIVFDSKYRACLLDFDTVDAEGGAMVPISNNGVALSCRNKDRRSTSNGEKRRVTVSGVQAMRKMTANFCGTAQYVSPEMLGQCCWSYSSDLWALGAIVYEMVYGVHMFPGDNTFDVMKRVVIGVQSENVAFPQVSLGPETDAFERTKDFILKLCRTDPTKRLGVDAETGLFNSLSIRQHPFFGDFDWDLVDGQVLTFRAPPTEDPTVSLYAQYHTPPVHDPEYAKYVYEATADANPFERWAREASGGRRSSGRFGEEDTGFNLRVTEMARKMEQGDGDEWDSNETDDVMDDVGIRFTGHAHPDFTE